jgi:4-amino-4-deoxy-L-arabinose transferase-like glycosyltransferase
LGHQLTLDMLLSFWLLAFLACFLMAQLEYDNRRRRAWWMLGCWAAIAFAVLTKGLIGIIAPAATGLAYAFWQGDRRVLRRLNLRWGVPLLALIAVPWFVLAARANPAFLKFFIVREHFQRFLTPIELRSEPWWFFCAVLIVGILPWAPAAVRTLLLAVRQRMPRGEFDAAGVLLTWCAFLFLFFSLSNAKLIPYILPVVPALALLCARPGRAGRADVGMGAALTLLSGAAILLATNSPWQSSKVAAVAVAARTALSCTGALLGLGALATFELLRRRHDLAALSVLCAAWFLTSLGITVGATDAQGAFSAKAAALALKNTASAETPVFSLQLYDQTLPFYLGRTVTLVGYRDEFALGLDQDPARGIADVAEFSERWQRLSQGYAVMRPLTRDLLLAEGLPMREIAQFKNRVVESRR